MGSPSDTKSAKRSSGPSASDFYDVRGLLSEDEQQIQDLVARFVDDRVLPIIADAFDQHRFPSELVGEIGEMGLLGCGLEGYGCAGLNQVSYGVVCQELERGDSGLRSFVSVQGSLCMWPIHTYGSEEQKQRWLPGMAEGKLIGCFGLTEPDGGSDPGTMRTHAKRDGDDWIIDGAKMWITNGSIADIAIVWAETEEGVRGFLVEKGTTGYTTRDIMKKYSLRASITSELFFDSVRVPDSNRLPGAQGLAAPLGCLTQARYGITWGAIGAAIACFEEAQEFASTRKVFGRTLAETQTIQRRLADMARRITLARLLSLQLGRLKDQGTMHHTQVSMAKWSNVRMALDVARDARDILGAGGISVEFGAIRHMLNLESVITYEGTETIHELIVGRQITGHHAF
ncbi:MAG: acyl-CoA dehydrogenase family protein [Acidobacteriota bacterium]|nr:acyl-CoA dehydrogenase family protein [Acidobacteriota bacterium]MDH3784844.1 acyl-CoA dehydrogenase family protein [Acidobacteriota bacterium]